MDAIKILKDVYNVVQKSNDIEIMEKIITAQAAVLDMQEKISKLQIENKELKEKDEIKENIERYPGTTMITLKNENPKIPYCSTCYGNTGRLIQLKIREELCQCHNCNSHFYFSESPNSTQIRNLFK